MAILIIKDWSSNFLFNNVLPCLTKILTFAKKNVAVKNNLLSQSIVEDGKNGKNYYVAKIMP